MKNLYILANGKFQELETKLRQKPFWERFAIIFWLSGPFVMLWEIKIGLGPKFGG